MSADEQAIRDAVAAWMKASADGDLPRVLALMDDDVVFLGPGRPPMRGKSGFAEASKAMEGKVRVEGHFLHEKELYLASAADEIYLNPDAGLLINGLEAEVSFYKRMMDKLKIEPQFLQFKEYKSPEVFTREKMTPEIRSMLESVLTDIQERFIQAVTADRKIEAAHFRQLIQRGIFPAPLALQEHLVTALGYEDEIQSKLMVDKAGGGKEYRSISASDYLKAVRDRSPAPRKNRVALVGGLGQ